MNNLKTILKNDMKLAMKAKDKTKLGILRVVIAEISREEAGLKELNEVETISLLTKLVKNLKDIDDEKTQEEVKILKSYYERKLLF